MTTLVNHSRSLISYTIWADDRLLAAAEGISDAQFSEISDRLAHMLGTQRYWHGNWTQSTWEEPRFASLAEAREAYGASHEALRAFAEGLTQDGWERSEAWWKQWGYDATLPVGESITQVFYHGVQHRSEMAEQLTAWGHSPGDIDYLQYLQALAGVDLK